MTASNEYRLALQEDERNGYRYSAPELIELGAAFLIEDGNPEPTDAEIEAYFADLQDAHETDEYLLLSGEGEPF